MGEWITVAQGCVMSAFPEKHLKSSKSAQHLCFWVRERTAEIYVMDRKV